MVVCEHDTPEMDCAEFPNIVAANHDLTYEQIAKIEQELAK